MTYLDEKLPKCQTQRPPVPPEAKPNGKSENFPIQFYELVMQMFGEYKNEIKFSFSENKRIGKKTT